MIGSCDGVLLQSFVYIASFPQVITAIVEQGPWTTIFRLLKKGPTHILDGLLVVIAVLVVGMVGGLFYLDRAVAPEVQAVEKVLPDGQFPR